MKVLRVTLPVLAVLAWGSSFSLAQEAQGPNTREQQTWSQWSVMTGVSFMKGDYGADDDTTMIFAPLTVRYELKRFQFAATVPFLWMKGPEAAAQQAGSGDIREHYGLGDVTLAATVNLYPEADSVLPYVEVTGKVKLPTAAARKFMGTGSTDYTIQVDAFKSFGRITPFAMIGWKFRGDADDIYDDILGSPYKLRDSLIGSAGAIVKINDQVSVGASYDFATKSSNASSAGIQEVMSFVAFKPRQEWSVVGYGTIGFTDATSDFGVGIQVKRTL